MDRGAWQASSTLSVFQNPVLNVCLRHLCCAIQICTNGWSPMDFGLEAPLGDTQVTGRHTRSRCQPEEQPLDLEEDRLEGAASAPPSRRPTGERDLGLSLLQEHCVCGNKRALGNHSSTSNQK